MNILPFYCRYIRCPIDICCKQQMMATKDNMEIWIILLAITIVASKGVSKKKDFSESRGDISSDIQNLKVSELDRFRNKDLDRLDFAIARDRTKF